MRDTLKSSYSTHAGNCDRLMTELCAQLNHLLQGNDVTLATPIERRIKTWESILGKLDRKDLAVADVSTLDDLIGIRLITLFRRDAERIHQILTDNFSVISSEDTSARLSDAQFGYQSMHYVVNLPPKWTELPTMNGLGLYKIEIQVRTMAQHIWAAVSHKLQYKNEIGVPLEVRRSINRASALLETVDLEFERVLTEREKYKEALPKDNSETLNPYEQLNVDTLEMLLDISFPCENKMYDEPYSDFLTELNNAGIRTSRHLTDVIAEHYDQVMALEEQEVAQFNETLAIESDRRTISSKDPRDTYLARHYRKVFYSHGGLLRQIIDLHKSK